MHLKLYGGIVCRAQSHKYIFEKMYRYLIGEGDAQSHKQNHKQCLPAIGFNDKIQKANINGNPYQGLACPPENKIEKRVSKAVQKQK